MPRVPATSDDIARELARALSSCSGVRVAVLFGSWARGSATPASDVDVAVKGPVDRLDLAATLSRHLEREVDVVDLDSVDIPLLRQIVNHGVVVYEGARGAGAAWRSHALADLEIDGPWYARMRDAWLERVARRGIVDGRS